MVGHHHCTPGTAVGNYSLNKNERPERGAYAPETETRELSQNNEQTDEQTDEAKPLSTATCVLGYVVYVCVLGGKGFGTPKHA